MRLYSPILELIMLLLTDALKTRIESAIQAAQAAGDLPPFELTIVEVRPARQRAQGDYSCAVAQGLARFAGKPPQEIAEAIVKHLPAGDLLANVEAAKGFINLRLSEDWLRQQTETIISEGDHLAELDLGAGKRAQVEFVSANPTGPLHIGRSRGAMVGDTMARLLQAAGYTVEREYYFNNAGAQMRNLGNSLRLRYLEALGMPVEFPDDGTFYKGDYLIDLAKKLIEEKGNTLVEEDWQPFKEAAEQKIFEMIKATLARVNIHHDVFFNENSLYDSGAVDATLKALEANGYAYRAEKPEIESEKGDEKEDTGGKGEAVWFRSSRFGDDNDRVIVKSTGEPTYTLPDIAYHKNKIERGFDVMVNVLGADHNAQHKVVKYGVQALGKDPSGIHVIIIQLVKMVKDGKEVKISTRAGNYETLDDLIDQTSADAVRYLLLNRSADTHLNFDMDLAVKQSNENPVYYIQYAHVRCAGIFREAKLRGVTDDGADLKHLGEPELEFLRKVLELPEIIMLSATLYEPHRIAFYALDLARLFHPIFDNVRVLHSEVPPEVAKARLRFFRAAQVVFRRLLDLMGMSAPEYM